VRIPAVLALCAVGAVAAFLLLRPGDDAPALPPVAAVRFDSAPLQSELTREAERLRAVEAVGSGQLDTLLAQDPLDLTIPSVTAAGVTATDVAIRRRGDVAAVEATVELAQLARLSPTEVSDLELDAAASRTSEIVVKGKAKALGFSVPVRVRVHVDAGGAVVAQPEGLPIGATTLFSDPRVKVRGLRATPLPGGRLRVRATATVVG
jgi:hypothetical protein